MTPLTHPLRLAAATLGLISVLVGDTPIPPAVYNIETVAGSDRTGDGGAATLAVLGDAQGVCIDRAGNIYVADTIGQRIRKITPAGMISTIAGTGVAGYTGDGGPAMDARLNAPYGIALDAAGNLYIADLANNRVRKVSLNGNISTVAGSDPDRLLAPRNVVLDDAGNLYVSEFEGHRIRRIAPGGAVSVFAGTGTAGVIGEGGTPASAQLNSPAGMVFDRAGNLYVADSGNNVIRMITGNRLMTVAALAANQLYRPTSIVFDPAGNLYIADSGNHRIQKLSAAGTISTLAGAGRDLTITAAGDLIAAAGNRLQRITPSGTVTSIAGGGSVLFAGDGGPAASAALNGPASVAIDAAGNLWIADGGNGRVRKVSSSGEISTAVDHLSYPAGVALDAAGNLYIADQNGDRIRKLTASGVLTTVAGTGLPGYNGDGAAVNAQLSSPSAVAIDFSGNLYIADTGNQRVRKVDARGVLETIAGNGSRGSAPNNALAVYSPLDSPRGICLDAYGNLYIADTANNTIRKVSPDGIISTIAASGLTQPRGVAIDAAGNLWIADTGNHRVRRMTTDGMITTIAGSGSAGFSGDGGLAAAAQLQSPTAIAVDAAGQVWIADSGNNRIRKLTVAQPAVIDAQKAGLTIMNAASLQPGPIAPGSLVAIFGAALGPMEGVSGAFQAPGQLPAQLAGSLLFFDGRPAPLLYAQDGQINAQAPFEIAGQSVSEVEVLYQGKSKGKTLVQIAPASPALFNVVFNQDGSLNSAANPAPRGSTIILYATGGGQTTPAGITGKASASPYGKPALPVKLTIGDYPAELPYAGDAPGFVGLMQINARVPSGFLPTGILPIVLRVGDAASPNNVMVVTR